jgi:RNA polymerase sigma-70 factor, ECF subfamily
MLLSAIKQSASFRCGNPLGLPTMAKDQWHDRRIKEISGIAIESEASILKQIAAGNRDAVALCIDRFGGLVWSLARKFCKNATDAEDAVQEIFTEIWRIAGRFDPQMGTEVTFISTIARRRLIDKQRKAGRTPSIESLSPATKTEQVNDVQPAEIQEEVNRAQNALASLNDEQQTALRLSIHEGHSHNEIAKRMDVPLGTVKTNIRRGLIRLREMLGTEDEDKGGAK